MTTTTYKKTRLNSPLGLFTASELSNVEPGYNDWHINRRGVTHPTFTYNSKTNRLLHTGAASISPESLRDLADLCKAIFDAAD